MSGRRTKGAMAAMTAGVLAACSSGGSSTPPTTTAPPPSTSVVTADGALKLGLLLPSSGPGATLGQSLAAGAQLATRQINAAGGVLGRSVTTVVADEGDSPTAAAAAMRSLVEVPVDVVIGPASSRSAFSVLGPAVDAGIAVCSPTNTAIGLTAYPDRGLYLRTIPSDALQAVALGALVERTGETTVAVLVPDDDFGDAFADALTADLSARGLTVTGVAAYDPGTDARNAAVTATFAETPAAVVLIGSGDDGAAMIAALRARQPDLPIFVNDAMKSAAVTAALGERAGAILEGVTGVAPHAEPLATEFVRQFAEDHPDVSDDFAAYAYDCVNAIAVAAEAAGSDDPRAIVDELESITARGDLCDDFANCSELLSDGQNIDLRGASGELDLMADGEVRSGVYRVFTFDAAGSPVDSASIEVP